MAGKISSEVKQRLMAAGQWSAFLARRDELKAQGFKAEDAKLKALAELARGPLASEGPSSSLPASPSDLADARAAEPEIIRWVARNIDVEAPDPSACPDPFAWTLLRMCKDSPAFTQFFVKELWGKLIPSRSQLDAQDTGEVDGKVTIDLIDRIAAMRDKANRYADEHYRNPVTGKKVKEAS